MRRVFARIGLCLAIGIGAAWNAIGAGDIVAQLGLSHADAAKNALDSFTGGFVPVYAIRTQLKTASAQTRAAIVEQVLTWTKAYVSSAEFRSAYAKAREEAKPAALEASGTADDAARAQQQEFEKQIAEMRKNAAQMPPDQRKAVEEAIKQAIEMRKQMESNEDVKKAQREAFEAQRTEDEEKYRKAMDDWKASYPADPKQLVAKRLRDFLAVSGTVNFEAKLVTSGGTQRFADPKYEQQSADWKLCYRAGRLPVEKARAFAQAWLAELK